MKEAFRQITQAKATIIRSPAKKLQLNPLVDRELVPALVAEVRRFTAVERMPRANIP
jgi:hypothetical protein